MGRLDDIYDIRLATEDDIVPIMDFIRTEWNPNHIMANSEAFFRYQFQDGRDVRFGLAVNKQTKSIDAICGYIYHSQAIEKRDYSISIWSTRKEGTAPFIGIELYKRMKSLIAPARYCQGAGANPKTAVPLLKRIMKYSVDTMKHYYKLNEQAEYKIAKVEKIRRSVASREALQYTLRPITAISDIEDSFKEIAADNIPYKDEWYYNWRYFEHPVYEYKAWAVKDSGKIIALLLAREVAQNGATILRVVDFLGKGEVLIGLHDAFEALICENGYEYIDFWCYGIAHNCLDKAGFVLRDEDDPNIIPNYFEPFLQQNVEVWMACESQDTRLCKGDGDQDRPNYVSGNMAALQLLDEEYRRRGIIKG